MSDESNEISNFKKEELNEDELDYEEDENNHLNAYNNNNNNNNTNAQDNESEQNADVKSNVPASDGKTKLADDDSDGEIKSDDDNRDDLDDGELPSPQPRSKDEWKAKGTVEGDEAVKAKDEQEDGQESEKHSEEEGEINDGEKVKKAFIPRVLCKYYQRGKCTWGRTCKFLHPGVNDVGGYSLLEFQDPTAAKSVIQQPAQLVKDAIGGVDAAGEDAEAPKTESAWERGLRHAKEMKEKAMRRKQMEKDQFDDKKMNLSLKEFENEKENDERYFNIEKPTNADDDLEDEDLSLFANIARVRNEDKAERANAQNVNYRSQSQNIGQQRNYNDNYDRDSRRSGGSNDFRNRQFNRNIPTYSSNKIKSPPLPTHNASKGRADEWHDPWDRSRQGKKPTGGNRRDTKTSNSYSSSDSDSKSRSRSRSRSRSSYSSKSSYSYSSRSNSRSFSRSPTSRSKNNTDRQSRALQKNKDKLAPTNKPTAASASKATNLPGRQVSEFSLKKIAENKGKRKGSNARSDDSSASSYSSKSDDDEDDDEDDDDDISDSDSDSEIDSYSDEDEEKSSRNKKKLSSKQAAGGKTSLKRPADGKISLDTKKAKLSPIGKQTSSGKAPEKDKKQMIKDQLKLLESALNKKKAMTK